MNANGVARTITRLFLTTALVLSVSAIAPAQFLSGPGQENHDAQQNDRDNRQNNHDDSRDKDDHRPGVDKVLYIWAQDQAQVAPDFLAVIDFDEQSPKYGEVINTVPVP